MKKRAFGKLYKELFYVPKHEKLPDKVFRCRMVVSLLTILACTAIMAASTFALFYSEVSTDHSTLAGAYYSVTVDKAENGVYICDLAFEDKHTFVIKADGTASTGYCKIQVGENIYYTEQIFQGSSLTLTIQAAQGTPIIFTPGWGTLSEEICKNEIRHSETHHTTYKVEPTARLSSIAAHYGVTEEDILIYNNLLAVAVAEESTTPLLAVGMELKIPNPAEDATPYKVPYATYVIEPTATLDAISAHYSISIEDIIAFNDTNTFSVGMSLKIPNADPYIPDYAVPYATYTVEATATLEDISEYYDVSVSDILTFNGITELTVGNVIGIPGVSPDTPSYVAPVTEPPASTGENTGDNTQDENNDPPVVDDTVSGDDTGTEEQPSEQQPAQEPVSEELAVLYPTDNDYYLISESTITLKNADILLYKGHEYETGEDYQKELDRRITGIEAVADIENKDGEYFCKIVTQTEKLSLCLEITENIEQGYLKIIIGESEYYTVQIKKDAYIRLDIVAPIGTEIRFEAYEGISPAFTKGDLIYGDNIKDDTDGNNPLLDHTWLISQITQEQPAVETIATEETPSVSEQPTTEEPVTETPTEETSTTEQPIEEAPAPVETPSTEETPTPDDTTSGGEDNGGEEPVEEPTPTGDEPTDTGATE